MRDRNGSPNRRNVIPSVGDSRSKGPAMTSCDDVENDDLDVDVLRILDV